jgi:TorA maturation chaperone TorD
MSQHDSDTPGNAAARETLARLLAACYYEPGAEFAEERVFDTIHDAAGRIDGELAAAALGLRDAFATAEIDELLVDYTRLFLGPTHARARPYGSVWLDADAALMRDSTLEVIDLYALGGFEIAEAFRDLPDHVAAELEFLYLLTFRRNRAQVTGDADALATIEALRRRFLDEHLGRWIPPFTAALRAGAETPYYRALGELTDRFVALECSRGSD